MATVYRKKRDRGKKNAKYYFDYVDENGRRVSKPGLTDKAATKRMASKLEDEAFLIRTGATDPDIQHFAALRKTPVVELLIEFEKNLKRRQRTAKHIKLSMSRLRAVMDGCDFKMLDDIDAPVAEDFIADYCDKKSLGNRTQNHYCQVVEQFARGSLTAERQRRI